MGHFTPVPKKVLSNLQIMSKLILYFSWVLQVSCCSINKSKDATVGWARNQTGEIQNACVGKPFVK
jgi:hypothetical protein